MRTELSFAPLAQLETELLAVTASDTQTAKGPDAKPRAGPSDRRRSRQGAAAAAVLASGEFKAGAQRNRAAPCPRRTESQTPAHRRPRQEGQGHRRTPVAMPPAPPCATPSRARFATGLCAAGLRMGLTLPAACARAAVEGALSPTSIPTPTEASARTSERPVLHPRRPRRRRSARAAGRLQRRRHHRRKPELHPHPGQRAGQRAHPDRIRPPRRRHGDRRSACSAKSTPPTSSTN